MDALNAVDEDLTLAREKLLVFLCGWLGGPKEYAARFGPIRIPAVHAGRRGGDRHARLAQWVRRGRQHGGGGQPGLRRRPKPGAILPGR